MGDFKDLLTEVRDLLKENLEATRGVERELKRATGGMSREDVQKMYEEQQRKFFTTLSSILPPGIRETFAKASKKYPGG